MTPGHCMRDSRSRRTRSRSCGRSSSNSVSQVVCVCKYVRACSCGFSSLYNTCSGEGEGQFNLIKVWYG